MMMMLTSRLSSLQSMEKMKVEIELSSAQHSNDDIKKQLLVVRIDAIEQSDADRSFDWHVLAARPRGCERRLLHVFTPARLPAAAATVAATVASLAAVKQQRRRQQRERRPINKQIKTKRKRAALRAVGALRKAAG